MPIHAMKRALLLLVLIVLSGCAQNKTKQTFFWGEYENLVYQMYAEPGSVDPLTQVEKLTADIQKAQAKGLPVAPGIHAHLAYMYILQGKLSSAREAFLKEKQLYPESTHFIDGMLKRMDRKSKS